MPMYTFVCECGFSEEYLMAMRERDATMLLCPQCGERLRRAMDMPTLGKPAYQMHAVMSDGRHVPGHFGKYAKKK